MFFFAREKNKSEMKSVKKNIDAILRSSTWEKKREHNT